MAKLIYGVGFNSGGKYKTQNCGVKDPAYATWRNMMERSYSDNFHARKPSYIGCSVASDWHDFQDFADWFYNHVDSGKGYCLDKDILIQGNKVYSSETCCFVPIELNNLILSRDRNRGAYPQGVCFDKSKKVFTSSLKINGKSKHLGFFDCPEKAHETYIAAKERYVKNKAIEWANRIEWGVFVALMKWSLPNV